MPKPYKPGRPKPRPRPRPRVEDTSMEPLGWTQMPQQQAMRVDGHEGAGHGGSGSYGGDRGNDAGDGGGSLGIGDVPAGQRGRASVDRTGAVTGIEGGEPGGWDSAEALFNRIRNTPGYKAYQTAQVGSLFAGALGAFAGLGLRAISDWSRASPEEREAMRAEARAETARREARQAAGDISEAENERRTRVAGTGTGQPPEEQGTGVDAPTAFDEIMQRVEERMKERETRRATDTEQVAGPALTYDPNWLNPATSALERTRQRLRTLGAM